MSTAKALLARGGARTEARARATPCPATRTNKRGQAAICGAPRVQNAVERARATWWCPRCAAYTDGSHGLALRGRAAGGGV